jgi:hypothetical protein
VAHFQNASGLFGRCRQAGNLGSPARYRRGEKGVRTEEIPMIKYLAIISALAAFAGAPALAQQSTAPAQTIQDKDKDSAKGTKGASEYAPGETQDRGTVKGIKPSPGVTTGSGSGAGSRHTGSDSPR